ncbi:glycosyltransferase family 2 protein [Nostoc sp. LPT]|uniref:glycosyltransferase family 2 protein n=1 Tax=Nostoc sp. LPT TaxID=2815387 RepID=UPI0025F075E5|nr:glycosyltransferase family 2 protein [Nostoc sp. LPT]
MKFSIVISTYNRLNLLQRAIDSARNQTIECEVVVADDCSSDDTQTYVKSLGDKIVYHRNEVNLGHAATVNAGVAKASGDWIKFLDDDDYLAPNCIEEMAKAIALRLDAVICSCVAAQVDGNEVELSRTPQVGPGLAFYIPQADIHYGMLLELVPFGTPVQVACRRDAFLQSGGWDSTLDANCDDIDSWIRIAQFGDAIFFNQCLAYRTIWPGAYNQKFSLSRRLATNILMKEKIYALVNEQHRSKIPVFQDIKNYLRLHWILVALKQKNLKSFLSMIDPSILSPRSWKFLLTAVSSRRSQGNNSQIRKLVLIELYYDVWQNAQNKSASLHNLELNSERVVDLPVNAQSNSQC